MTPTARLIDITRLSSRIGRVFTGVDRVELAYLRAAHADLVPSYAIARTALGYVFLDQSGVATLLDRIDAQDWPKPDFVSRVNRRLDQASKTGQTLLRQLSARRCIRSKLKPMLRAALPDGFHYLNVGHSNLTEQMLSDIKQISGSRIAILVHDTIPLDFPKFQRDGTVQVFESKLRRVAIYADLVICVSKAGAHDAKRHFERFGRVPPMVPAHIGIDLPAVAPITDDLRPAVPYFVAVGTIEPRKNHALLLDVWSDFPEPRPELVICGANGWSNADVMARLERGVPGVTVYHDLSDSALAAMIAGAQALLFPTLAEGFGLPPHEALALGTPVVCSSLPVMGETLGNNAIYLDPSDRYAWTKEIKRLAGADRQQGRRKIDPPTWDAHFKIVFTMT